jgi:NAD(P)H-hydrate epimerase
MTCPLPEVRRPRCLSLRALGAIRQMLEQAEVLALGPGLGRHRETQDLVRRLLGEVAGPTVLDADGLNAVAPSPEALREHRGHLVLTPHLGEFSRLSSLPVAAIAEAPLERAGEYAAEMGITLVLKGSPSVVADADGRVYVNPTGNAGMATAGCGDVLTGTIAGLLAQGATPLDAAVAGVYVHGAAGDLARDRLGEWGMTAGDICAALPEAVVQAARGQPGDRSGHLPGPQS